MISDELLEALRTLQDYCKIAYCEECPFEKNYGCMFSTGDTPLAWDSEREDYE